MRIGLVQMHVDEDTATNIERARAGVMAAAQQGASIVVLPEMFCCPYRTECFISEAQVQGGPIFTQLQKMAIDAAVYLVAGSVPECEPSGAQGIKRYNTSYVFSPEGMLLAKHRKMHLFDVNIPGKIAFMESQTFSPRESITLVETPGLTFGVAICYDLRFPELFKRMALSGASLILVPAAFNMTTGPVHWELLARARAVDNQVYVGLCSPASVEGDRFVAYGHSLVANCWGEIVGALNKKPDILLVDLDLNHQEQVRKQLPLLAHSKVTY